MKFSTTQALLLAGSALAAPSPMSAAPHRLARRQMNAGGITDPVILNFALTLEHLENTFYMEALSKFSRADFDAVGASPRLRFNIGEIGRDETTHVNFLTSALQAAGATPVKACSYDFGLTDVTTFLQTANILEGVGISAYLGAAAAIMEDAYLTAAGSILTVESRHSAYLRDNNEPHPQSPFPSAFDIPLSVNQVYTLASQFITSCPPENPKLPVKAFPALQAGPFTLNPARAGQTAYLRTVSSRVSGTLYCGWPTVNGPIFTGPAKIDLDGTRATCQIPEGITGQAYVVLTKDNKSITDANTAAGPAVIPIQVPYTYPGFPM